MDSKKLKHVRANFLNKESYLSLYATKNEDAIRFQEESFSDTEIRPQFYHDIDRIIYSLSYTRYSDKTQVFSFASNDHISKRMIHVQLVSKIARTIARALNLNEDLTEAIALGHDIGHTPIGHTGEHILNEISMRELGEVFAHNVQGVRVYMDLERNGKGNNLTLQVLDGILCHNGEFVSSKYEPVAKTKESFLKEYEQCYKDPAMLTKLRPMTLEGCVVRISDLIGYLGRDIEDAVRLGVLKKEEIPQSITDVLGNTNSSIVNTIILNIIDHSLGKPYISMSPEVFRAIVDLKKFNYQHIYDKANTKEQIEILTIEFNYLYKVYLNDLETKNESSEIYTSFLRGKDAKYLECTSAKRMVIDFLSGMTDDYLIACYNKRK